MNEFALFSHSWIVYKFRIFDYFTAPDNECFPKTVYIWTDIQQNYLNLSTIERPINAGHLNPYTFEWNFHQNYLNLSTIEQLFIDIPADLSGFTQETAPDYEWFS